MRGSCIKSEDICVFLCEGCEGLQGYIAHLERRGRKALTLDCAERGARRCCEILNGVYPGIRMDEVGEDEIAALQGALLDRYRTRTAMTYLQSFSGFQRWLTGRDAASEAGLLWNREGTERLWIDAEDYRRLYSAAAPRERVMLALGATMGLRREEVMTLTVGQIRDGGIEIHGKGHGPKGKVEWRPMSEGVRKALAEWMPVRDGILRRSGSQCDFLIVSPKGKGMRAEAMNRALDRVGRKTGVKATPHSLRRLFATTMDDAGTDLETIARMMRHNSPTTTMQCYLKADPRRMRQASDAVDRLLLARGQHIYTTMPIQYQARCAHCPYNVDGLEVKEICLRKSPRETYVVRLSNAVRTRSKGSGSSGRPRCATPSRASPRIC